jgi:hypothetical protein
MLEFLRRRATPRKLRLFACACCRGLWHLLPDEASRAAVEAAERYADGHGGEADLRAARRGAKAAAELAWVLWDEGVPQAEAAAVAATAEAAEAAARAAEYAAAAAQAEAQEVAAWKGQQRRQSDLLRDLFGNPFRPVTFRPSWGTADVVSLARAAYDEPVLPAGALDPARLAVLADALEDAGCTSVDLLGHLRGPGPHVRGCWAVDLLLGKS